MKVLLDCHVAFQLAHGGQQIQIEQTKRALEAIGVEVEYLRWWDDTQRGDVLHHFGRLSETLIRLAQQKGMKVVLTELLGGMGARSPLALHAQWFVMRAMEICLPEMFTARMGWNSFRLADACIALTGWEAHLMRRMFRAPGERVQVLPNGVEEVFLAPGERRCGEWLVTTASILPVKRIVETARAAVVAETPYWVIGKPFAEDDAYYHEFLEIQRAQPQLVRYEGAVSDRAALARIYREARGFVMLSRWETLSISALEAAACGCPLLLSELPWAHTVFGDTVSYCPRTAGDAGIAAALRRFYDAAPQIPAPPRPLSWEEVGRKLRAIYNSLVVSAA